MPIRADLRKHYGKRWREEIRPRILARAGHKCEQCGKPDRKRVWVYRPEHGEDQYWSLYSGLLQKWTYCALGGGGNFRLFPRQWHLARRILVVLAVCHRNHRSGEDDDSNLVAWCQWCHLHHDAGQHRETRATRKDAARPLLQEARA